MAQLKTGLWVDALIRRAQSHGAFACVLERGDRDAGTVLIVQRQGNEQYLYTPERNMVGDRVWRRQMHDAESLNEALTKRRNFDPDIIVVEIEDREGRHFIEEPVLDDPESQGPSAEPLAEAKALFRDR